ncbi:hypothetical protein AVEN_136151-1, partial [Araneus ventricosus]
RPEECKANLEIFPRMANIVRSDTAVDSSDKKDRESSNGGGGLLIAVDRKISSHIINLQLPSSS